MKPPPRARSTPNPDSQRQPVVVIKLEQMQDRPPRFAYLWKTADVGSVFRFSGARDGFSRPLASAQYWCRKYRPDLEVSHSVSVDGVLVRSSGGEPEGAVNIGMTSTLAAFLSGPFMESCRSALPKVTLRFITGHSLLIASRIEARALDFSVVFEDPVDPIPGFLRQPLQQQRLFLVHQKRRGAKPLAMSLANLAELPLVMPASPNVARAVLDRASALSGIAPNIAAEADTLFSIVSAVQSGIGQAVVRPSICRHCPVTGIAMAIGPPLSMMISIPMPADSPLSRAAEAVRQLIGASFDRWLVAGPAA
jgi:DNA-binding transcriptional LysR family regulator